MIVDRNEQIADLILSQTYEERIDLAKHLSDATRDWLAGGGDVSDLDASYFAELLFNWSENQQSDEEQS